MTGSKNEKLQECRLKDRYRRTHDAKSAAKAWDSARATREVEITTPKVPVFGDAHHVAQCLHPAVWSKFITGIDVRNVDPNDPRGTFVETISFQGTALQTKVAFSHQVHAHAGGVLRFWWADSVAPPELLLRDEGIIVVRATEVDDVSEIWLRKRLTVPQIDHPISWAITPQLARALLTQMLLQFSGTYAAYGPSGNASGAAPSQQGQQNLERWERYLSGRPELTWSLE